MLFISYAREDTSSALRLVQELRADGIDCFLDPEAVEGDPFWREAIVRAFPRCTAMVCLVSDFAAQSPWVEQERRAFPGRKLWIELPGSRRLPSADTPSLIPAARAVVRIGAALGTARRSGTTGCRETLGNPTLTPELQERLAKGIAAETAGRGIAELEAWRDRFLIDLLALKAGRN